MWQWLHLQQHTQHHNIEVVTVSREEPLCSLTQVELGREDGGREVAGWDEV